MYVYDIYFNIWNLFLFVCIYYVNRLFMIKIMGNDLKILIYVCIDFN